MYSYDGWQFYFQRSLAIARLYFRKSDNRIVVIGDSHSRIIKNSSGVLSHHVGPITLHRMGDSTEMEAWFNESLSFPRRLRFLHFPAISKNSIMVLSFGEIDI